MIKTFTYPHNLSLEGIPELDEPGFLFFYNPEIEQLVPGINGLTQSLLNECEGFEFTELHTSPWMTVSKGPVDGIGWHKEGLTDQDYSLVYALDDSNAGLQVGDTVFEHKRGRVVIFPSNTNHRVGRIEQSKRVALAFLMHRREND